MTKFLFMKCMLLLFLISEVSAQSRPISGTVTDGASRQGLPGVTVLVKGTSTGTSTDVDGTYTINVPASGVLSFSFIGYTTVERAVGNATTIDVTLNVDAAQLNEVVITGYSTQTQQSFTGSAKVVSSENLERKNVSNVSQALAGEVAGVRDINTSGQPGSTGTIRIRGLGSVNGNRDPLYVVDGVPFTGNLNAINPADIESATVLKDAAATAIYGSRGANGVVVITTKSGRGKASYIEADASTGTNMALLPRYSTIKSPEQYIGLSWEALYNQGVALNNANPTNFANTRLFSTSGIRTNYNMWNATAAELIDPATRTVRPGVTRKYNPENWEDFAFQNAARNEVNVKFGGSTGKTNYYSSFGFLDDQGYIINSDFQRLSARLNVTQEIKKWLTGSVNFGYARTESNNNGQSEDSGSIFWFADNMPPIYPLFMRDAEGKLLTDPIFGGNRFDYGGGSNATSRGFGGLTNAISDATYDVNRNNRNELNGSANLNFNILEGLTFENRLGLQYYNDKYVNRGNKYYGSSASQNGSLYTEREELTSFNLLNLLRYNKTFGQHGIEALAAHEASNWRRSLLIASGYNLVDPDLLDLSNAVVFNPSNSYTNAYSLESYFAQVNYDFSKKYFLSGTIRRDGSSRFREDKWGTFGSVGAAWLISSENFMGNLPILNNLKLKASYGLIGDQAGVGYYPGYDLFNVDNLNDAPAFSFYTKGNPNLTWETSKMFQTGIEFGLGEFLDGSFDYYIKNTDNLIFERRVGPSIGYALLLVNDGKLRNRGFEFDLTGHVLKTEDYRLDLNVNGEIFDNEITEMPLDPVTGKQKPIDVQAPYGWSVGHSIFDFYMREYAGVDATDGRAMWNVVYNDANNNNTVDAGEGIADLTNYLAGNPDVRESDLKTTTTKTYTSATQKYVGKTAIPKIRGAFNLAGGYKGFDLSAQFIYSLGGYAYDYRYASLMGNGLVGSNNWHTDILNRWQSADAPGDGVVPRLSNNADLNAAGASTRFLTKANYLGLNNVRLSYTVPANLTEKVGLGGLTVWVSGDNLWINTARKGFNPAISEAGSSNRDNSQSRYQYNPLSTFTGGLRVKF